MAVRRSSGHWVEGIESVDLLVDQLRNVPAKAKVQVRKAIVEATRDMRSDMAARASWSSRIPGAINVRVSYAQAKAEIRVAQRRAPHARPYEGLSGATFRHPVYGHRDRRWAEQAARPFFFPVVREHGAKVREAVETAVFASLPR